MEGVEHLGKYVFEITKAKVEALKKGGGLLVGGEEGDGKMQVDAGVDEDVERIEEVLEDVDEGPEEPEEVPV
jgi:intron-binding protein aquarius